LVSLFLLFFFFSSRRRHTRFSRDWSSDVCSSDLLTWYHLSFFAVSLAMLGMAGGAVHVFLRPDKYGPARAPQALARVTLAFALRSEERRVGKEGRSRWAPGRGER